MKANKKTVFIILGLVSVIALALIINNTLLKEDKKMNNTGTVDEVVSNEQLKMVDTTRVIINPTVIVENGKIYNLGLQNKNEEKYLQCKIKSNDTYIYDSNLIENNQKIDEDVFNYKNKIGEYECVAEFYTYDLDKNMLGQTNVNISVIVK